ncbi:uncharacterized protein LOC127136388 [Lathyrus oleraceus]|uniref:uncharacterized protein LOC127136388 n=1 Tax=Pisum sativum TaxID=3888 RepID=UPI0021D2C051|nr:uncharacterized protein LOC127136388 [Pisum sativum]
MMMTMMGFKSVNLIYYALFLTILVNVNASIHHYNNEPFTHRSNAFFFHAGTEAIFSSSSSFIRFETVSFNRPRESAISYGQMQTHTGLVEAIILEVKDRNIIGGFYFNPKSDLICCTPDLAKEYNCNVGEVIIHNNPNNPDFPKRIKTFFRGISEVAHMDLQTVEINATGMYYLYFMFCDPNLKGTTVTGKTVWRNPNGYLPGKMAPLMTLYGFMSLAYLLLGLLWFLRFLQFWKEKDFMRISDLNGPSMTFPNLKDLKNLQLLELRNCLITGPIPDYIGEMTNLRSKLQYVYWFYPKFNSGIEKAKLHVYD